MSKKQISITIDEEVYNYIQTVAIKDRRSLSSEIECAVVYYLDYINCEKEGE